MELEPKYLELMKCSTCKKYLTPPVNICQAGHSFCSTCSLENSQCSICPLTSMIFHNTQIEELLKLSFLVCTNQQCGHLISLYTLPNHKKLCPICPYLTCISGCGEFVTDLGNHLITQHNWNQTNIENSVIFTATEAEWNTNYEWPLSVGLLEKYSILIAAKTTNKMMHLCIYNLSTIDLIIKAKVIKNTGRLKFKGLIPGLKEYMNSDSKLPHFNCEVAVLMKSFATAGAAPNQFQVSVDIQVSEKPQI